MASKVPFEEVPGLHTQPHIKPYYGLVQGYERPSPSDSQKDKPDFNLISSLLASWATMAHWSVHLKSNLMTVPKSTTLLISFEVNNPWSCDAFQLSVLRDNTQIWPHSGGSPICQPNLGQSYTADVFYARRIYHVDTIDKKAGSFQRQKWVRPKPTLAERRSFRQA